MGGRKSYSIKKVTGRGLGKFKKPLTESLFNQDSTGIAITTAKIATENKKQQNEFVKTVSLLKYLVKPSLKKAVSTELSKEIENLSKKYGTKNKPLSKSETKYLSDALSRRRLNK